jgi:hypothetical protein
MDLFELYNDACADLNTQQSGHLRPQRNFQSWINTISLDLFNHIYSLGGKNQKLKDLLDLAFLKPVNAPLTVSAGVDYDFIAAPANYAYYSSVRAFKNESSNCGCIVPGMDILDGERICRGYDDPDFREIRELFKGNSVGETKATKVDNNRWGSALGHKLKKPSWNRVLITEVEGGFKVVPKGMGIVLLDYYRYPTKAFFAYTTNPDGSVNYNLAGSTQLDWPLQAKPMFLALIKQRFSSWTNQDNKYQQSIAEIAQTF